MKIRTCSMCQRRRECVECETERWADVRSGYSGEAPSADHNTRVYLCAECAVEAGAPPDAVARAVSSSAKRAP